MRTSLSSFLTSKRHDSQGPDMVGYSYHIDEILNDISKAISRSLTSNLWNVRGKE